MAVSSKAWAEITANHSSGRLPRLWQSGKPSYIICQPVVISTPPHAGMAHALESMSAAARGVFTLNTSMHLSASHGSMHHQLITQLWGQATAPKAGRQPPTTSHQSCDAAQSLVIDTPDCDQGHEVSRAHRVGGKVLPIYPTPQVQIL